MALGLIADNDRFAMIYNMTGTMVAMTHVPAALHGAAAVRGHAHHPAAAHERRRPRWAPVRSRRSDASTGPRPLPGVGAGSLLVFILATGYYITPALVGGRSGQLIANMIAYHMQSSLNWGLAAALGGLLLAFVGVFCLFYQRLVGLERMRLG